MRTILSTLCLLWSLTGCQKPAATNNLTNGKILVIGHSGSGIPGVNNNLPANSWEGVERALGFYGADGVELDVQLSADSVLFMYHDPELEASSTCTGCIFNLNSQDLDQCSFKAVTTNIEQTCYLTRLERVIATYSKTINKPLIFIDLHVGLGCGITEAQKEWYYATTLHAINDLLSKYDAYEYVFVQSNGVEWLLEARNKFPSVKVLLDLDINEANIDLAEVNGFYGIASKNDHITKREVELAHSKGLRVQLYGVAGNFTAAIDKSPDYILADNIPLLQNTLDY